MQLKQLPVHRSGRNVLYDATVTLLRGISQIFFQAKAIPGLLILIAFVVADWQMALIVVLGCISSTVAGVLMRFPASKVRAGHHGFCGALVGAAAFAAMDSGWLAFLVSVLGGLLCGPVTWLLVQAFNSPPLKALQLPYLTGPFCVVASLMYFATSGNHVSQVPVVLDESLTALFFRSIVSNVSQVVLVDSVLVGLLILLALFLSHWKVGLAALLGSTMLSVVAVTTGQDRLLLGHGMLGYSEVLVSIALAAVFLKGTWQPWVMAVVGTLLVGVVRIPLQHLYGVYTWPFVITTWVLLAAVHFLPGIKRR
ncbi:urea transporter [Arthrobacter sp. H35-D1]|uniref:urea transporter n=1 Tax=Arthrobacter sp. H35-D1 TaxID=3046202 RepID=UPI0024B92F6C|nr:urea transporter [Arthrobacter sp. H35-D1]MDJ0312803.1 urea transporter [Arthrobacter sp. H35-D1]